MIRAAVLLMVSALLLSSCSSATALSPGHLASRAIEVRPIDTPYDTTFRAAVHTVQFLNLTNTHTEKDAGLIVETTTDPGTSKKAAAIGTPIVASIILLGPLGLLIGAPIGAALGTIDTSTKFDLNLFLYPLGEKQTRMRISISADGKPVDDQQTIDRIWVITQREAVIELGEPIPHDLEQKTQKILSPPKTKLITRSGNLTNSTGGLSPQPSRS